MHTIVIVELYNLYMYYCLIVKCMSVTNSVPLDTVAMGFEWAVQFILRQHSLPVS